MGHSEHGAILDGCGVFCGVYGSLAACGTIVAVRVGLVLWVSFESFDPLEKPRALSEGWEPEIRSGLRWAGMSGPSTVAKWAQRKAVGSEPPTAGAWGRLWVEGLVVE